MKLPALTALLACAAVSAPLAAEEFDIVTLLEAARSEPPLFVFDSTGKIRKQAKNFEDVYGLQVHATKSKAPATIRMLVGEAQAGNVQADVALLLDTPAATVKLIKPGHVFSYVPPDMVDLIPETARDPLVVSHSPVVWSYHTGLNDSCPVSNIWELTNAEWAGRVALSDPLGKPDFTDWFNQLSMHHDDAIAAAYQAQYGQPLETDHASATEAWVAALAGNRPLLTSSDSDVAAAVGHPDSTGNFIGLMSTAKYRENDNGMKLGICASMEPMVGFLSPKFLVITTGTDSPNAARLFVHYLLTEAGWAPQAIDGKMATNLTHSVPKGEPSGAMKHIDRLWAYDISTSAEDWATRQDWQDIWALNRNGN